MTSYVCAAIMEGRCRFFWCSRNNSSFFKSRSLLAAVKKAGCSFSFLVFGQRCDELSLWCCRLVNFFLVNTGWKTYFVVFCVWLWPYEWLTLNYTLKRKKFIRSCRLENKCLYYRFTYFTNELHLLKINILKEKSCLMEICFLVIYGYSYTFVANFDVNYYDRQIN